MKKYIFLVIAVAIIAIIIICFDMTNKIDNKDKNANFSTNDIKEIKINSDIWNFSGEGDKLEMKFTDTSDCGIIKKCDDNLRKNISAILNKYKDTNTACTEFRIDYKLRGSKVYQSKYTIPMDGEYKYLVDILNLHSFKKQFYPVYKLDINSIKHISFSTNDKSITVSSRTQVSNILEILKNIYLEEEIRFMTVPTRREVFIEIIGLNNELLMRKILTENAQNELEGYY